MNIYKPGASIAAANPFLPGQVQVSLPAAGPSQIYAQLPQGLSAERLYPVSLRRIQTGAALFCPATGNNNWRLRPVSMSSEGAQGPPSAGGPSSAGGSSSGDVIEVQRQRIGAARVKITKYLKDAEHRKDAHDMAIQLGHMLEQLARKTPLDDLDLESIKDFEETTARWGVEKEDERKRDLASLKVEGARTDEAENTTGSEPAAPTDEDAAKILQELPVKPGHRVYHSSYGPVDVLETGVEKNRAVVKIRLGTHVVTVEYSEDAFFPLGSEKALDAFERELDISYKYLPLVVGAAYTFLHIERYSRQLSREGSPGSEKACHDLNLWGKCLTSARYYLTRTGLNSGAMNDLPLESNFLYTNLPDAVPEKRKRYFAEDAESGRKLLSAAVFLEWFFDKIFKAAGDDVIELGFRTFRDSMKALVETISGLGVDRRLLSANTAVSMVMCANIRDDVMARFFRERDKFTVARRMTAEERERYNRVFAVGSYKADRERYDKMRDGDADAITSFAVPMAELIRGDRRLSSAGIIVPIPGRESEGWPVRTLAKEIGQRTNIHVRSDLWRERPETRVEAGAQGQGFMMKERMAKVSYRLSLGSEDAVKGRRVILVDDNVTTGATWRAAAAALRKAGAINVMLVSATVTEDVG